MPLKTSSLLFRLHSSFFFFFFFLRGKFETDHCNEILLSPVAYGLGKFPGLMPKCRFRMLKSDILVTGLTTHHLKKKKKTEGKERSQKPRRPD